MASSSSIFGEMKTSSENTTSTKVITSTEEKKPNPALFFPSLMQLATTALFNQLEKNDQSLDEFVAQQRNEDGLPNEAGLKSNAEYQKVEAALQKMLQPEINKLLEQVYRGKRDEIADVLNASLPFLSVILKARGEVEVESNGLRIEAKEEVKVDSNNLPIKATEEVEMDSNSLEKEHKEESKKEPKESRKVKIEGTLLETALHEGDLSYVQEHSASEKINPRDERCGFCVRPTSPENIKDLPPNKNCAYFLVQSVAGQSPSELYFIDKRIDEREVKQVSKLSFLKNKTISMLSTTLFPNANNATGYTDIEELTPMELAHITAHTGHTHEEGIANMLMRYHRMLPEGELEIAKQYQKQFPKGYEEQDQKKLAEGKAAIDNIFKSLEAIQGLAKVKGDIGQTILKRCSKNLEKFRNHFVSEEKIRTGRNVNRELANYAYEIYDRYYFVFCYFYQNAYHHIGMIRNDVAFQNVVGYVQRFLPFCDKMAVCHGPRELVQGGKILIRNLAYRLGNNTLTLDYFDDSDANWIIGENCASNRAPYFSKDRKGCGGPTWRETSFLEEIVEAKDFSFASIGRSIETHLANISTASQEPVQRSFVPRKGS